MGGLMSVYALMDYGHVYGRAAALSPSLWMMAGQVEEMIRRARVRPDTVLYMDYGSEELGNHSNMLKAFGRTVALLIEKGVMLSCRLIPGGTHCEASWERQIPFFMETLQYERGDR